METFDKLIEYLDPMDGLMLTRQYAVSRKMPLCFPRYEVKLRTWHGDYSGMGETPAEALLDAWTNRSLGEAERTKELAKPQEDIGSTASHEPA